MLKRAFLCGAMLCLCLPGNVLAANSEAEFDRSLADGDTSLHLESDIQFSEAHSSDVSSTVTVLNISSELPVNLRGAYSGVDGGPGSKNNNNGRLLSISASEGSALNFNGRPLVISGFGIKGNDGKSAEGQGGAIYSSTTLTIGGSGNVSFKNNKALGGNGLSSSADGMSGGRGGAVNSNDQLYFISTGTYLFEGNTAQGGNGDGGNAMGAGRGGAAFANKGMTFSGSGDYKFVNNLAKAGDNLRGVTNNYTGAAGQGGALLSWNKMNFDGTGRYTFVGNRAQGGAGVFSGTSGQGGAIYGRGVTEFSNSGTYVFENNIAAGVDADGVSTVSAGHGGAVFVYNTLDFSGSGTYSFRGNKALAGNSRNSGGYTYSSGIGGAIYAGNTLTFGGSGSYSFEGNTAQGGNSSNSGDSKQSGWGGAIYAANNLNASGGTYTFTGNTAKGGLASGGARTTDSGLGGAVYAAKALSMSNANFIGNMAVTANYGDYTSGLGGAVYAKGAVDLADSGLIGNSASNFGGAIYNASSSATTLKNTTLAGNQAGMAGGAIYAKGDVALLADVGKSTVITGNTASGKSDGVYIDTNGGARNISVDGQGSVLLGDSVRAVGGNAVAFSKNGEGSLVWGKYNYFSNNSSLNFNAGNTMLGSDFSLEADNLALNLSKGHSLYIDLTGREHSSALFAGLGSLNVEAGSVINLLFNADPGVAPELSLGNWLISAGDYSDWDIASLTLDIATTINGTAYIGAIITVDASGLWFNMGNLRATPIPASAGLLGLGLIGLARMKRRFAKAA